MGRSCSVTESASETRLLLEQQEKFEQQRRTWMDQLCALNDENVQLKLEKDRLQSFIDKVVSENS